MSEHHPTAAELEILRVLWAHGPLSVREVYDQLAERGTVYTTTLKIMQNMVDKRLLSRASAGRAHIYTATVAQERTTTAVLGGLVDRLFAGSTSRLVLHALDHGAISDSELAEIEALLQAKAGKGTARKPHGSTGATP